MDGEQRSFIVPNLQRYLITGVLTLIPLWVTWVALSFLFALFAGLGRPLVRGLARAVQGVSPGVADVLLQPWFASSLALLIVALGIYALGWSTTNVIGRRMLRDFEELLDRIPLVRAIYGSVKTLVSTLEAKPGDSVQRVVLIEFPSPDMKAVGFVTRTVVDRETGKELAIVYVPTTPNPTSGYMEIVPVDRLTPTDWSFEEATRFVVTGGTSGPDRLAFERPERPERDGPGTAELR
jgi:uncharacterized membrane protein